MMNALLSSVSYAAMNAGGGGTYPTQASLTLLDFAEDPVNTVNDFTFSFTVAEAGTYLIAIFGGTGGSSTADSTYQAFTVTNSGSLREIAFAENTEYEVTGFFEFIAPTAGTYDFTYNQLNQRFRIRAELYQVSAGNLQLATAEITTASGTTQTTSPISFNQDEAYMSVIQHRTPAGTWSDPDNTDNTVKNTFESDFYWYSNVGQISVAGDYTAEVFGPTFNNRNQAALLRIPYLTEAESTSAIIDVLTTHVVTGGQGAIVRSGTAWAIYGSAAQGHINVMRSTTYLVATGY